MISARGTAILCVGLLVAPSPEFLAQPAQAPGNQQNQPPSLAASQLDSLVAPVALYPDPILSQVLVASTYPLEIVEAARWMKQNGNLQPKQRADAAAKQSWDASVQALVVLPEVLTRLNQDVSWTTDLGNAFLAQPDDVMAAIQRMRQKASAAGALQSSKEQTVTTTTENNQPVIEIQPANTEVVYVPEYNPEAIWGPAPAYYPYPPVYYPAAARAIAFGVGMAVGAIWGSGGWGWGCNWGRNNVVINNNFINNNHFNRVNVGAGNSWVHNPAHRANVPYNNRNVANRYGGANRVATPRPSVGQTQQKLNQLGGGNGTAGRGTPGQGAANRMNGQGQAGRGTPGQGAANRMNGAVGQGAANRLNGTPAQGTANRMNQGGARPSGGGDRIGNRQIPGSGGGAGAFRGMSQGGARTQMNSSRGFASRGGGGGARRGGGGRRR
jgi:hypothetical protein